jgi:hypothetical protein
LLEEKPSAVAALTRGADAPKEIGMTSRYHNLVIMTTTGEPYQRVLEPDTPDQQGIKMSMTVGFCCMDGLLFGGYKDLKDPSNTEDPNGEEKMRRFEIAQRIRRSMEEDKDFDLTMGDQQYLDGLLARRWNTDIYGQCHSSIYSTADSEPKPRAVREAVLKELAKSISNED